MIGCLNCPITINCPITTVKDKAANAPITFEEIGTVMIRPHLISFLGTVARKFFHTFVREIPKKYHVDSKAFPLYRW